VAVAQRSERARAEPAAATVPVVAAARTVTAIDDEKLSWMWPSDGKIIATFDEGRNKGIDIAGRPGQQVMAASAGKVMYAGSGIRGYGNLVIVKHSNSLLSAYAHNRSIVVKEGETVSKGQVIAEMGDSDADSVKLHFEIRQQGKPVDPSRFLPSR
jgi:lipoprotein NlpD